MGRLTKRPTDTANFGHEQLGEQHGRVDVAAHKRVHIDDLQRLAIYVHQPHAVNCKQGSWQGLGLTLWG